MVDFHERDTRRGIGDSTERIGEDDEPLEEASGEEPPTEAHPDAPSDEEANHDHHAHDLDTLGVGVITISSTRSLEDDPAGDVIGAAFEAEGHAITTRELVPDDYDRVQDVVSAVARRRDVDVVVTTGGTGVTPDDVTIEAVEPLFEKTLPGFGELFRRRSEAEIGSRVVATRAMGGIADGVPVFCLPGSENAVRLGVEEIVLPEAGHLAGLAHRDDPVE